MYVQNVRRAINSSSSGCARRRRRRLGLSLELSGALLLASVIFFQSACSSASDGNRDSAAMIAVTSPAGVRYEIDVTEVTQRQYANFLASTTQSPGTEHPSCVWNTSYAPLFSDDTGGLGCHPPPEIGPSYWYSPDSTPNFAVVCIDWCDAMAFCQWAGKRLCGAIGGGGSSVAEHANANVDQWYDACSGGGTSAYPYGSEFDADACWGSADVGSSSGCHGATTPYSSIFDMSGGVSEWEDACEDASGERLCLVRGGNGASYPEEMRCDALAQASLRTVSAGRGFRCCRD